MQFINCLIFRSKIVVFHMVIFRPLKQEKTLAKIHGPDHVTQIFKVKFFEFQCFCVETPGVDPH